MKNKVGIYYFRSLYSQSACSLSVGRFSDFLLNRGYKVKLEVLKQNDFIDMSDKIDGILGQDIIIYKTNYKDFEYGIRFFENLIKREKDKQFYLIGPFAVLNKERILKKYNFITDIINIQDKNEVENVFRKYNKRVVKKTIISGIDREIEFKEKGKYINLEASSGCIYNCSFCHIKLMNYEKYTKDVRNLVDEMENIINLLDKRYFIFNDSVFWKNNSDNDRIKEFIREVKKRNLKFYFMIYLSLTNKIPDDILIGLKEIGLIRVFFGVENISNSFSKNNNKYISATDTENFIEKLSNLNISYHIGFILFSPYTTYNELKENIDFLYKLKKLFRPGIIVEKMRILLGSKDANLLYEDNSKIDQAYNYKILDSKVDKFYQVVCDYFDKINIRNFEQFFSGINLSLTILNDMGLSEQYEVFKIRYNELLEYVNDNLYKILLKMLKKFEFSGRDIEMLKNLYSLAEANYITYISYLKKHNLDVYQMIPHGTEDLNVW